MAWVDSFFFFLSNLQIKDFVDLLFLYFIFYFVLKFSERSGVYQIFVGLGVVALAFFLSEHFELMAVHTVLKNIFGNFFLILVLLFQSEIRRGLTQLGSQSLFSQVESPERALFHDELAKGLRALSAKAMGALIVFENKIDLAPYIEGEVSFKSEINGELIQSLFLPQSPLHDGALIVKEGKIIKASAFLPLSTNPALDKNLGTRHRAALGVSEITDAKVVVLSEELRKVAFVEEGRLRYVQDPSSLDQELRGFLSSKTKGVA